METMKKNENNKSTNTVDTTSLYDDFSIEFVSAQDEREALAVLQYAPSFNSFRSFSNFNNFDNFN